MYNSLEISNAKREKLIWNHFPWSRINKKTLTDYRKYIFCKSVWRKKKNRSDFLWKSCELRRFKIITNYISEISLVVIEYFFEQPMQEKKVRYLCLSLFHTLCRNICLIFTDLNLNCVSLIKRTYRRSRI